MIDSLIHTGMNLASKRSALACGFIVVCFMQLATGWALPPMERGPDGPSKRQYSVDGWMEVDRIKLLLKAGISCK